MSIETYLHAAKAFGGHVAAGTTASASGKEFTEHLPKFVEALGKLPLASLDAALEQLTDPLWSLGALGLLAAKTLLADFGNHVDAFMTQITGFLQGVDGAQLRHCPAALVILCQKLSDALVARNQAIRGIRILDLAIRTLQTDARQLTSIHSILLEVCLTSSNLKAALPFLIDDFEDFSSELKGGDCKPVLLYLYYGGMIYTGLKKYDEALFFFDACLRVPALSMSHIMLESYKKFVLLSLIHSGEVPSPPKCSAQVVNRILKPNATPYNELVTAFATHNPVELNSVIVRHQDTIRRDINFGLVKQVKNVQTKLNIQRLTKTFLTLSLGDLAARVQLSGGAPQAEKLILAMINDGEIYAKINQRDGMVVFLDNKEKYNTAKMMQKIENQIGVCVGLNKRLSELNEKLSTNPEYVSKVVLSNDDEGISSSKISSLRAGHGLETV